MIGLFDGYNGGFGFTESATVCQEKSDSVCERSVKLKPPL